MYRNGNRRAKRAHPVNLNLRDVGVQRSMFRVVGGLGELRHHDHGEDAQDHNDHEQLDECETGCSDA